MAQIENLKAKIKTNLEKYNVKYSTLEFECEECPQKRKVEKMKH